MGSLVAHLAAMGSAATCKATGMRARHQISLYFGVLLFANGMGDPTGLLTLLVLFILKDHLRLAAPAVALFEAITHIPYYGAFLFGLLRDTWSPFRCRDRGYLLLAAPLGVGCYVWLAAVPLSYAHLLGAIFAAMIAYQVLDAATQALLTRVAQREAMTGRLSALLEAIETIVSVVAMLFGGWMVSHWSPEVFFSLPLASRRSCSSWRFRSHARSFTQRTETWTAGPERTGARSPNSCDTAPCGPAQPSSYSLTFPLGGQRRSSIT